MGHVAAPAVEVRRHLRRVEGHLPDLAISGTVEVDAEVRRRCDQVVSRRNGGSDGGRNGGSRGLDRGAGGRRGRRAGRHGGRWLGRGRSGADDVVIAEECERREPRRSGPPMPPPPGEPGRRGLAGSRWHGPGSPRGRPTASIRASTYATGDVGGRLQIVLDRSSAAPPSPWVDVLAYLVCRFLVGRCLVGRPDRPGRRPPRRPSRSARVRWARCRCTRAVAGRHPIAARDLIRRLVVQVPQGDGGPLVEGQIHRWPPRGAGRAGPRGTAGGGGSRRATARTSRRRRRRSFEARFTSTRRTQAPGASSAPTFAQSRWARAKASWVRSSALDGHRSATTRAPPCRRTRP